MLGVGSGEVEGLYQACPGHRFEEMFQRRRVIKDGLDGVVVGKREGVVVILGILDEGSDDVVRELMGERGMGEVL